MLRPNFHGQHIGRYTKHTSNPGTDENCVGTDERNPLENTKTPPGTTRELHGERKEHRRLRFRGDRVFDVAISHAWRWREELILASWQHRDAVGCSGTPARAPPTHSDLRRGDTPSPLKNSSLSDADLLFLGLHFWEGFRAGPSWFLFFESETSSVPLLLLFLLLLLWFDVSRGWAQHDGLGSMA